MATESRTPWAMSGKGYEFCNCEFGCGCNFGGFPNSKDGSCRGLIGFIINKGRCGDVDLSGVKCATIAVWPKAIHEGNGKAVFIVDPATTDRQVEALTQVFSGQLGGMPWELLAPTLEVIGLEKAKVSVSGSGPKSTLTVEGIGEGRGDTLKNPVTGEDHLVEVHLPNGFIWRRGECAQGTHSARSGPLSISAEQSNLIVYDFDWSNA